MEKAFKVWLFSMKFENSTSLFSRDPFPLWEQKWFLVCSTTPIILGVTLKLDFLLFFFSTSLWEKAIRLLDSSTYYFKK